MQTIFPLLVFKLFFFFAFMCTTLFSLCCSISTETILLTVWSGSLLTWSVNRWWEYNKQGQSKSKLPTARCRFGKLYPGNWSFLHRLLCLLFTSYLIMLQTPSPARNSPVTLNHSGSHIKGAGTKMRLSERFITVWEWSVLIMWSVKSGIQPSFHIVFLVPLEFSHIGFASTSTHIL